MNLNLHQNQRRNHLIGLVISPAEYSLRSILQSGSLPDLSNRNQGVYSLESDLLGLNAQYPANLIRLETQCHGPAHAGQSNHIIQLLNHALDTQPMNDIPAA